MEFLDGTDIVEPIRILSLSLSFSHSRSLSLSLSLSPPNWHSYLHSCWLVLPHPLALSLLTRPLSHPLSLSLTL